MTLAINWSSQDNLGRPQYSDHAPIRNANILSWNIMNQCSRTADRTNNGFGVNETDADYQSRLSRLATAIADNARQHSIDIIAFQEAPDKRSPHFQHFIGRLKQAFGPDFVIEAQYADDTDIPLDPSSRLTIFNGKKLQARNVTNSHKLKLGQQKNHIQIIEFTAANASRPFLFANAHFGSGAESHLAMYTLLSQGVILAGDLNGDVNYHLESRHEPVNSVAGVNFSFDMGNNRRNNQTSQDTIVTPQHYRPQQTSRATVHAAKPNATKPKVDATKPKVDATKPKVDATKPKVDATKPKVDATKPKVDATKPKVDAAKPKVETQKIEKHEKIADKNTETTVAHLVPSYRRRLFQWLGHENIAFVRHPIMLTAAVVGIGMLYAMGFAFTAIAVAGMSYVALYTLSRFSASVNEQAALFIVAPEEWKSHHNAAYNLGEQSKNWAPYLQSFARPSAYTSAYQVGLMNVESSIGSSSSRIPDIKLR